MKIRTRRINSTTVRRTEDSGKKMILTNSTIVKRRMVRIIIMKSRTVRINITHGYSWTYDDSPL